MTPAREDQAILIGLCVAALAFLLGWDTGRRAVLEDRPPPAPPPPITVTCPAPAAPVIRVPPSQVVVTTCDPLENLRQAPVPRPLLGAK